MNAQRESRRRPGGSRRPGRRVVGIAIAVVATVAVGVGVPTAYGALIPVPPSPILDLSTRESWDTGAAMAQLCPAPRRVDFFMDVTHWFYDQVSGTITRDETNGVGDASLDQGEIFAFNGHCEFPVTEVKDDVGPAQQVSRPLVNCGDEVTLRETVTQSFSTSSTYTTSVSVGASFDVSVIKDVLGFSGRTEVTNSWSFGKDQSVSRSVAIDVPARTKGYFERVPVIRTVISQPVFVLEQYYRIDSNGETDLNGWEDSGSIRITSPAFRTSSAADALDADGFPSGAIRAQDDPVTAADCD